MTHNAAPGFLGGIATRAAPGAPGVVDIWPHARCKLALCLALRIAAFLEISFGFCIIGGVCFGGFGLGCGWPAFCVDPCCGDAEMLKEINQNDNNSVYIL